MEQSQEFSLCQLSCHPVYVKIHFNSENSLRKEDLEYGSSYAVGEIA